MMLRALCLCAGVAVAPLSAIAQVSLSYIAPLDDADVPDPQADADVEPAYEPTYEPKPVVRLRALDKVSGFATDFRVPVGETVAYDRLEITARACYATPPEEPPENVAFLEIAALAPELSDTRNVGDEAPALEFSGWMFSSSPGVNALEHPVYDVWVIACSAADPDAEAGQE